MAKKQRTPQEKKVLSYLKDRRNMYGESRSRAIKSIRRRKTLVNRSNRRIVAQQIRIIDTNISSETIEVSTQVVTRKRWRKFADPPLVRFVEDRLRRRQRLGINRQQKLSTLLKVAKRKLRKKRGRLYWQERIEAQVERNNNG